MKLQKLPSDFEGALWDIYKGLITNPAYKGTPEAAMKLAVKATGAYFEQSTDEIDRLNESFKPAKATPAKKVGKAGGNNNARKKIEPKPATKPAAEKRSKASEIKRMRNVAATVGAKARADKAAAKQHRRVARR